MISDLLFFPHQTKDVMFKSSRSLEPVLELNDSNRYDRTTSNIDQLHDWERVQRPG